MNQQQKQQAIAGLALIALGLALYFLQGLGHSVVFFLVGGGFMVAYFYYREIGFLIPGCLILSLGVSSMKGSLAAAFSDRTVLGLGFIAITVIALLYQRAFVWWPLIPGGVLVLLGLSRTKEVMRALMEHWQLILVGVGLLIFLGAFFRPKAKPD